MRGLRHLGPCCVAVRVRLPSVCMFGLFLFLCGFACCVVGMRKSLRIWGSSAERECSGPFGFPAFLLWVLLGNLFLSELLIILLDFNSQQSVLACHCKSSAMCHATSFLKKFNQTVLSTVSNMPNFERWTCLSFG